MKLYIEGGDHLGSAILLTDTNRNIVYSASYNPFGEVTLTGDVEYNPRRPGQYQDNDFVYYNGYRYYEPATGRYLQPEPIFQNPQIVQAYAVAGYPLNAYAYAANNPLRFVDPSGRIIKVEGENAIRAYERMKDLLFEGTTFDWTPVPEGFIRRLIELEKDPNVMIHIYETPGALYNTRGGATLWHANPFFDLGKGSLCQNEHSGYKWNWDITLDKLSADADFINKNPLDAILFHELFGHVNEKMLGRESSNRKISENIARGFEKNYRDWANYPELQ